MSVQSVVTRGFGPGGRPDYVVLKGYTPIANTVVVMNPARLVFNPSTLGVLNNQAIAVSPASIVITGRLDKPKVSVHMLSARMTIRGRTFYAPTKPRIQPANMVFRGILRNAPQNRFIPINPAGMIMDGTTVETNQVVKPPPPVAYDITS